MRSSSSHAARTGSAGTDFTWKEHKICCWNDKRLATNLRHSEPGSLIAASTARSLPPVSHFRPADQCVRLVFGMRAEGVKRDRSGGRQDERSVNDDERFVIGGAARDSRGRSTASGRVAALPCPMPFRYFNCDLILPTSSALISPTVVTSPSLIRHRRKGPVMSPYWSNAIGPITPS